MEAIATQVPPESYLSASSTLRSQSIYWMGLGVQGLLVCFWYISLEAFFLLFFLSWIQFFGVLCLVVSLGLFVHLSLFFPIPFGSAT
jgi:hypothetical protein